MKQAILLGIFAIFGLSACGGGTSPQEQAEQQKLEAEAQSLDSLSNLAEKKQTEIEQEIQALDQLMNEITD